MEYKYNKPTVTFGLVENKVIEKPRISSQELQLDNLLLTHIMFLAQSGKDEWQILESLETWVNSRGSRFSDWRKPTEKLRWGHKVTPELLRAWVDKIRDEL